MVARINPSKPVRHFLKEWRLERGLTQQQLADLLPIGSDGKPTGKDQISRWERNERGMTMGVQSALAEALQIAPMDLFRSPTSVPADNIDRKRKQLRLFSPDLADTLDDQFDVLLDRALEKQQITNR